ncbi:LOW QUALITY PROTEIN: vomeronasal type-1 receptor A14-like [Rattus rattus]|uniref:LOW QUALITY PROTEIN: vomeronasal type-1 receptor A14-like n=1 Tax=Rattus rattus TaxID=10117 RepID=UPI0013F2D8C8|nr:LOW QUALITY PROTEIN: vomeronasal type-1 receptor A14-like [Rattus rattus]
MMLLRFCSFPQPLSSYVMNTNSRLHTDSNIRNTFFTEIGIGISVNNLPLLFHIFKLIRGQRSRLTDLPIGLLSLINLLMLLMVAFIATDIFISWRGWDDIICKFLVYLYRCFRGLSLCTTCMLSVLQAITLSPRSSCLAKFKHKPPHQVSNAMLFLSVLYMFISSHLLLSITATPSLTTNDFIHVTQSCSILPLSYLMSSMFSTLLAIRNVFLISLMVLSTWYMVALLFRHRKQTQHLQGTSLSPKASPEQRATHSILMHKRGTQIKSSGYLQLSI